MQWDTHLVRVFQGDTLAKTVSTLSQQHGGMKNTADAIGFSSEKDLLDSIRRFRGK